MDFYGVLLQFEKRMSVNMQKINLEFRIMGRITEGADELVVNFDLHQFLT
jgi:hypothetical protein